MTKLPQVNSPEGKELGTRLFEKLFPKLNPTQRLLFSRAMKAGDIDKAISIVGNDLWVTTLDEVLDQPN